MNSFLRIKYLALSIILNVASSFVKRDKNKIAIGSWMGEAFIDNSRYLFEYLYNNRDFDLYWVGKKELNDNLKKDYPKAQYLVINRFSDCLKLLKCQFFFFSQDHDIDISKMNVFQGATLCYLHHGVPVKKWGCDGLNRNMGSNNAFLKKMRELEAGVTGRSLHYDYFVTASPLHDESNLTALSNRGCTRERNIHSGTPRNDMLVNFDEEYAKGLKRKYAELIGFSVSAKIILYLPTYRRSKTDIFSFSTIEEQDRKKIEHILKKKDMCLIEKSHIGEKVIISGNDSEGIKFIQSKVNVQELLLFSDYLITDYSGAFLDFILMDRPVIHFAYDLDYYRDVDSGLYYDINDFSAGPVVTKLDDLFDAVEHLETDKTKYRNKRIYVREKYMAYERGHASQYIVNKVVNDNHS